MSEPTAVPPPRRRRPSLRLLPRVRWAVQLTYAAFLLVVGWQFARYVAQAMGDGPLDARRPPAVEAFLPISALVALKRFLLTRIWDGVHPAGLTLLVAALLTAFLARKAFCSWVCPVGTASRVLEALGTRLWRRRWPRMPRRLDQILSGTKYLLLAFFAVTVFARMPLEEIDGFLHAPYNLAADARMLAFFRHPGVGTVAALGGLAALSLVVKHAWCRWLCPYGALLGLAGWLSPLRVGRDPSVCNGCKACTRACPVDIQVHARLRVLSPECSGCLSCVVACPTPGCLDVGRARGRVLSPWLVPALALAVMLGAWAVASATGFWETSVTDAAFRWAYRLVGMD